MRQIANRLRLYRTIALVTTLLVASLGACRG